MLQSIHLLVVEDSDETFEMVRRLLGDTTSVDFHLTRATAPEAALEELGRRDFDVCLLADPVVSTDGIEVLRALREDGHRLPIIVTSKGQEEGRDFEALAAGATSYLIARDLTADLLGRSIRYSHEHHRLIAEIERRAKLEMVLKNRFVSRASHELKGPLATTWRFVKHVADQDAGGINAEQEIYLQKALKNIQQLGGIVDVLIEVTLAESERLIVCPHAMELADIVVDVVESFDAAARTSRIELTGNVPDDLPAVRADAARLRRVLEQLIENALKFTPEGGRVRLDAYPDPSGTHVRVDLTDTGSGVEPELHDRIFERLYKESGTDDAGLPGLGLGLYLCREIVERLGGRIWVESIPGRGSTFAFTLPFVETPREAVGG